MQKIDYDFKLNYPSILEEGEIFRNFASKIEDLDISFPKYDGLLELKQLAWNWLNLSNLTKDKSELMVCNSGNHAILCILMSIKKSTQAIITEQFTYPAIKSLSREFNIDLIPCEIDSEGIIPNKLIELAEKKKSKILYIQPTIQNPTCSVMTLERRLQIVDIANKYNLTLIEDDAYRFLLPNPPASFLDLIPERTIHIESLSKPYNPFIKTAFIISPIKYTADIKEAIILTSSGNSILLSQLVCFLLKENRIDKLIYKKQRLAREKQKFINENLLNLKYKTVETAYHLWIEMPVNVSSNKLVSELMDNGIMVSDGNASLVGSNINKKEYIRIAIANEKDLATLKSNITKIRGQILNNK